MSFDFNISSIEWALAESIVKYFDVLVPLNKDINNHGLKYVCRLERSALFTWIYYLVGLGTRKNECELFLFFSIFLLMNLSSLNFYWYSRHDISKSLILLTPIIS